MKYQKGKIKNEHSHLKEFDDFLKNIEKIDEIERIIPGRISRQQKGTGKLFITLSYFTQSGIKYNLKKGSTAQELFVVCKENNKTIVEEKINIIIKKIYN